MRNAVLFDLGGTLVDYYRRDEFPGILRAAIAGVRQALEQAGRPVEPLGALWPRVAAEDHEAADCHVRPLEERLERIFQLDAGAASESLLGAMSRCFLAPIFARARRCDDALPALERLRAAGYRVAIVSNTPWGSPAQPWREELARQGLDRMVDLAVFCRDAGWRKPAPQIFHYTLEKIGLRPEECLFIGDDPRWDIAGPQAVGMAALLLDRAGTMAALDAPRMATLLDLPAWLQQERIR
jgi:putative hydrolase of the HAD superfamily